jgi:hypothetical protein
MNIGAMEGLSHPDRDVDYIYEKIGKGKTFQENLFLECHLPLSYYSDAGIINTIEFMRSLRKEGR